ncbi:MAG: choice-of-anchor J domain-containing protein [Muribaculaceae bacterium]|nr:choice-of-anchor J domain-containing protein [Muribaculaceae bacterium]
MKTATKFICAAALAASALISGCEDNFTHPPVILPPVTNVESSTTLSDFKNVAWNSLTTGPQQIGFNEDGDSIIFTGRVCSSDASGNIYKNIVIQGKNEAGEQVAMTFSVNRYDIYELFPFGQEVAVFATGLNIGGYANLLQFGAISGTQMTFMDESDFVAHVVRNGSALPEPAKVDTTLATIPEVVAANSDNAAKLLWQSRLVKFENVSWVEAGQPYAGAQTTNRYIMDADGNRLVVRNSSYADFSEELLPYGTGTVVGILSYFNNDWQLLLIDTTSCIGFDGEAPEPTPEVEPAGDGTAASPYNVAKALQVTTAMSSSDQQAAYVEGIITSISDISTDFGNATYAIADATGGATLGVYRGYWLNGDKFTSADQLTVGAKVVVSGTLVNYMGNTPQFTTGSHIVTYNGEGGQGSEPAPVEGSLYSALGEDEAALTTGWTIENVELGGAEYVWQWKEYNGKHYLNGSAFVNNTALTTEAYTVSPVIDLTGVTGCYFTFAHAAKFQTTLRDLCGVCIREEGATAWTKLTIPVWPEAGSWTFAESGNVDIAAFDGKKVQIAFLYKSSSAGADTWEIKNLAVYGNK